MYRPVCIDSRLLHENTNIGQRYQQRIEVGICFSYCLYEYYYSNQQSFKLNFFFFIKRNYHNKKIKLFFYSNVLFQYDLTLKIFDMVNL